ncbi:MAG: DUF5130 domain-containing protein [Pseudonocardiales bacterium]|nr:MAG: DUF5130 domain-containing protein [Pseudonocardiales bacterium]
MDPVKPAEVLVAPGDKQHRDPARRDSSQRDGSQREYASGEAVVGTGRISAARMVTPVLPTLPFTKSQLTTLDDALVRASRSANLHFGVYLGDLGADTRGRAEVLHDSMGKWADHAVLVAVSPGQQVVEVVTGCEAAHRLPDRECKLAVESMVSSFKAGDLAGGLTAGLRMLADHTDS